MLLLSVPAFEKKGRLQDIVVGLFTSEMIIFKDTISQLQGKTNNTVSLTTGTFPPHRCWGGEPVYRA